RPAHTSLSLLLSNHLAATESYTLSLHDALPISKGLVEFINNDEVVEFLGKENFEGVITKKGAKIEADFCVVAVGVKPNVDIAREDRKSTRLNSSHVSISYAVFCLKKKKITLCR